LKWTDPPVIKMMILITSLVLSMYNLDLPGLFFCQDTSQPTHLAGTNYIPQQTYRFELVAEDDVLTAIPIEVEDFELSGGGEGVMEEEEEAAKDFAVKYKPPVLCSRLRNSTRITVHVTGNLETHPQFASGNLTFRLADTVYRAKQINLSPQDSQGSLSQIFHQKLNGPHSSTSAVTVLYPLNNSITSVNRLEFESNNFWAPQHGYVLLKIGMSHIRLNASCGYVRLQNLATGSYNATFVLMNSLGEPQGHNVTVYWTYVNQLSASSEGHDNRSNLDLGIITPRSGTRTSSTDLQVSLGAASVPGGFGDMVFEVNKRKYFTLPKVNGLTFFKMPLLKNGINAVKVKLRDSQGQVVSESDEIRFEFTDLQLRENAPTLTLDAPIQSPGEVIISTDLPDNSLVLSYRIKGFNLHRDGLATLELKSADLTEDHSVIYLDDAEGEIEITHLRSLSYLATLSLVSYSGEFLGFQYSTQWHMRNSSLPMATWQDTPTATYLYNIVAKNDLRALMGVLEKTPDLVNCRSGDGRGPLFWAYEFGRMEMVDLLLQEGLSDEDLDSSGRSPPMLLTQSPGTTCTNQFQHTTCMPQQCTKCLPCSLNT